MLTLSGDQWQQLETRLALGCEACGRRLVDGWGRPRVGVRVVEVKHLMPGPEVGARVDTWDVAVCGRCYQKYRHEVGAAMARAA